jgi:hypothetical protein
LPEKANAILNAFISCIPLGLCDSLRINVDAYSAGAEIPGCGNHDAAIAAT